MTSNPLDAPPEVRQDDVIREVRANREAYAARFDYDVRAILRRARERAAEGDRETVTRDPRRLGSGV